ncbi:uncharacterized protein V2V93DRAFT_371511 [Kockiozyma suomiensis]|uniref:uncharacterized protein n=1 Tax=Kockiozyma suomiensis TaxID=1337062 RepID=UPI003342F292
MPSKLYRSLLIELGEWMSSARQRKSAVTQLLQQTMDMTPPPPPTSKSTSATRRGWSQADETKSEALDELHEKLRSVMRQQFRSLEKEKAEQGKLSQKARDANEILVYLRSQRTYKTLLDKYNPTATLEDHERIRLTARRVGLELPKDIEQRFKTEDEPDPESKDEEQPNDTTEKK